MIQRGSDTNVINLWNLLLYIQLLLHYVENTQENKNFIITDKAENNQRIKRNEEMCALGCWMLLGQYI